MIIARGTPLDALIDCEVARAASSRPEELAWLRPHRRGSRLSRRTAAPFSGPRTEPANLLQSQCASAALRLFRVSIGHSSTDAARTPKQQ